MSIKDIPVSIVGPGSQPAQSGDSVLTLNMPTAMESFVAPLMPRPEDIASMAGFREAMQWLQSTLDGYAEDGDPQVANLGYLDEENRELVNQVLGEGEVSLTYRSEWQARVQESVLAGVWRTFFLDADDRVVADLLEVAAVPHLAHAWARTEQAAPTFADDTATDGLANAMPILVEVEAARETYSENGTPHSINLSMLPMSEAELEFLDERLGRGPVDILSRAYGKCQVISTAFDKVWWVRYYNSMGTLILNSLEIVDVPVVVAAAPEDLADSAVRLREILAPYSSGN